MKKITIALPENYIKMLEDLGIKIGVSFSTLIRRAINDFVLELEELERQKVTHFFKFCIICGNLLKSPKDPYKYKNFNVIESRLCCFCYNEYKGKTLEEFPKSALEKIQKKLKNYRNHVEKK